MNAASSQLNVGITTWNSEFFLPHCLASLRHTVPGAELTVLDNNSSDRTVAIARDFGAAIMSKSCSQGDALDVLARSAARKYTLLIHSDVVLLSPDWWTTVHRHLETGMSLVSPEDIGCGPYTRPWGKGMPESSFLCFRTDAFPKLQVRRWRRRFGIRYFRRQVDFFGEHVTYNLPSRLQQAGLRWRAMAVHPSRSLPTALFTPEWRTEHWRDELGKLEYGLGNFYSLDGVVTHYHNWYDRRIDMTRSHGPRDTLEINGTGMPAAFLKAYSGKFVEDYTTGHVNLPVIR